MMIIIIVLLKRLLCPVTAKDPYTLILQSNIQ